MEHTSALEEKLKEVSEELEKKTKKPLIIDADPQYSTNLYGQKDIVKK